jgi:predicted dehydrogenase
MKQGRRSFLKVAGTFGLTMPVIGTSFFKNKEDKPLGIAIIGLGSYAKNQIGVALENSKEWKLVGIVTGTPSKVPDWKKRFPSIRDENVFNYENFDKIVNAKDIDVVYICLPNGLHPEFTIRAAKAGKHVICEKPMATTVKEAEEMLTACNKAGVKLAIGYRCHFEPFNQEVMRYGKEKTFGKINFMQTNFGFKIGDPTQWRLKKKMAGGGPLMDVGIYCVQGARYTLGMEPISVTAQYGPVTDQERFKEVEESISWQLTFPEGVTVDGFSSYKTNVETMFASCDKGNFEMSPAWSYGPLKGRNPNGEMKLPVVHHQTYQMNGMAPYFRSKEPLPDHFSGVEGLKDMKILMAIYEAARTGKRVKL